MRRITYRSGLSGLILVVGVVLTFVVMEVIGNLAPDLGEQTTFRLGLALLVACCAGAAALWGLLLCQIAGSDSARPVAAASAIAYPSTLMLALALLGMLEPIIVEEQRLELPIHVAYGVLFVPATLVACGLVGGAIGVALRDTRLSARLAGRSGLAGALAFLILDVVQHLLGRRVGGPNAAETATMITVTFVCMLGASIAASAAIGRTLAAWRGQVPEKTSAPEAASL